MSSAEFMGSSGPGADMQVEQDAQCQKVALHPTPNSMS